MAVLSAPAGATVLDWTGQLEIEFGAQFTSPGLELAVTGGGTALLTGPASLMFPGGAFSTSLSVPIYNQAPLVNFAAVVQNGPITVASVVPCTNAGHSAVGQGGMFQPTGTGPGAHGIFCIDGPNEIFGTSGLLGNAFVGVLGTPGSPFANIVVPLTAIGSGSTTLVANVTLGIGVAGAGMGWLTGVGAVRYVTTSPAGNVTFTTTLSETGFFSRSGTGGTLNGSIRLVSPISIQVAGVGALPLPGFARIEASFVAWAPEAGSLVLFGTGMLALAWRSRRR